MKKILIALMRLLPLRNAIVFESHPDFSDNSYALYQEFLRRGLQKTYRMYWMKTFRDTPSMELPEGVETFEAQPRGLGETLKRAYVLNCSRFIIDCNSFVSKRRKKQIRIHLGHGMPIKMDLEYSRKFGDCDKYLIQSEFWRELYETEILVPRDVLCPLGYPRNDVLVHPRQCPQWQRSVDSYERVIVWMPTYRQHRAHRERDLDIRYPYGLPCVHNEKEFNELEQCLKKNNVLMLFRPHPVQELSVFEQRTLTHICIANDSYLNQYGMTLYELLGCVDGLITDYSSVYFDYLLTGKPIALTIEDKEDYFTQYTPAFPEYKSYIKGYYIEKYGELLDFVQEMAQGIDSARDERKRAEAMFHASDREGKTAADITHMLEREYKLGE